MQSTLCHVAMSAMLALFLMSTTNAFQVAPNGNADKPQLSTNAAGLVEEHVMNAGIKSLASKTFQCTRATAKTGDGYAAALEDLLEEWTIPTDAAIGCLFVSPAFASNLEQIVEIAQEYLGDQTQLLTVVGGGVIGDGQEIEHACGMSFMGGVLPQDSSVELFSVTDGDNSMDGSVMASRLPHALGSSSREQRDPSHFVFADPHCNEVHSLLKNIDGIVAGGISVADPGQSSLAIGKKVLPRGSLVGATFTGNVGLDVVVTQGCRPVGPTYRVTSVDGPAVHELDCERALDQLQETMDNVMHESSDNSPKIQSDDFLGGIHKDEHGINESSEESLPDDFTLRQMTGFRPRSGSILLCGPQIQEGDFFRFHVQSKEIALNDWKAVLKRAETERLFLGKQAGKALGAFQISCMGRGEGLFGISDVDLRHVERLLPPNTPIAGLMANAEIGPVGIRMGRSESSKSVLHGFASVVAMLCDFSDMPAEDGNSLSSLGDITTEGAWE